MKLKKILYAGMREIKNLSSFNYLKYIETLEIDEKSVLFECQHGATLNGNIFYLLKEMCTQSKYKDFNIYLSVKKKNKDNILRILDNYGMSKCKIITTNTVNYYKKIASVKYLINDTSFLPFFIKRENQVYLNTWHGTPLKTLGKQVKNDFHNIGNVMKNFVISDYLYYPSEYTKNHMIEDYMLSNLSSNKFVLGGYPRNVIFFDEKNREKIRSQFSLSKKQIIAYMPTWRGTVANKQTNEHVEEICDYLKELDEKLKDDYVVYVNFHPFIQSSVDFSSYKKVKLFPKDIETYEFLNACDILVTDYSSVFFDYAIRRNKIILFTYDEEEYLNDRGMYLSLDELPFPKVSNTDELIKEIETPKAYDDTEFLETYCKYENENASSKILNLLLYNQESTLNIQNMPNNKKENVLVYAGNLAKNGLTSSLLNLLNNIDLNKRNYYITFYSDKVSVNKGVIKQLPLGVNYFPTNGRMNGNIIDKFVLVAYKMNKLTINKCLPLFEKLFKNEIKRRYGNISFNHVIQFTGYELRVQLLFSFFEKAKKIIYVHSNMMEEIRVRKNQHKQTLKYAYNNYDTVAIVTQDMCEPTKEISINDSHFKVVNNVFDYKRVLEKAKQEIKFDNDTVCNFKLEEVIDVLNNDEITKFINIGRFTKEKGHERLIHSFIRFSQDHPNACLIIIGGRGKNYKNIKEIVENSQCKNQIILIESLSNPYAILKQCDCFAFSSFYEGFGLVLLEADALGVPLFSTDILGPKGFLVEHGGLLVDNSEEGIYQGFCKYMNGDIKPLNVDYEEYNKIAIKQFEDMMEL